MRFYVVVELSGDRIGVSPITAAFLSGFEVRWDREGEVRTIPAYVIEDAQRVAIKDWDHTVIMWDQCIPLPEKRLPVTFNPPVSRS